MEIIGIVPKNYRDEVIVRLTNEEMNILANGSPYDSDRRTKYGVGDRMDIHARFRHAENVLAKLREAIKLPSQLRCLADTLEMGHPSMERIIDADFEVAKEPETEQ